MRREDAFALATIMTRLSEDHQSVLRLRYWEGLSFPEIGTRLCRSPDAVRKLWYRAVERLQAEMNADAARGNADVDSSDAGAPEPARA
jgi:RNA polymerase sigma factor (sigma-70 family)